MFILLVFCVLLLLVYLNGTKEYNYWKRRGIKHDRPYPFVGNNIKQLIHKISFNDFFIDIYRRYPNERFVGVYMGNKPTLIVREPCDIQRVLITDFNCFRSREMNIHNDKANILSKSMFRADGDLWNMLRQRLSKFFTTARLKAFVPLLVEKTEKLQILAAEYAKKGIEVDMKDLMARYSTDFMGSCIFGISTDALSNENSMLRKLSKKCFHLNTIDVVRLTLKTLMPRVCRNLANFSSDVHEKISALVMCIIERRNYEPTKGLDLIDLLLEVKKKGDMIGKSIEIKAPDDSPLTVKLEFDDSMIVAQAFLFFIAGFDTSSTTTSYTLHLLAFHQDIQSKCQEEVDNILKKYDNNICYDAIHELKYVKMCFSEAMRLHSSLGVIMRKSTTKYTFPDSDLTIDKDIKVIIVNQAMQMDGKYFEQPQEFIPERFSPENINNTSNHAYLPFGAGPRACIGGRMGLMQSLAGLAAILSKFTVHPGLNSKRHPESEPRSMFVQAVKGGVPLLLKDRCKTLKS